MADPRRFARTVRSALTALAGILVLAAPARAAVTNDTSAKTITMTGSSYTVVVDYNNKARVSSMVMNGHELLDTGEGIYAAVLDHALGWITSATLPAAPTVSTTSTTAAISFPLRSSTSPAIANETWTFTVAAGGLTFHESRTYTGTRTLDDQGSPVMRFGPTAVEQIRLPDDGGTLPAGGFATVPNQPNALSNPTGTRVVAQEQIHYVLLNETQGNAVEISGTTNHDAVARGRATTFNRVTVGSSNDLQLKVLTSGNGLTYDTRSGGTPSGYAAPYPNGGHSQSDGGPIYAPASVSASTTDTVTLTFTPRTWSGYYDLGTTNGVDEYAASHAINDVGRRMMIDKDLGAMTEQPGNYSQEPAIEQHWIAQLAEALPDNTSAVTTIKNGLSQIVKSGSDQDANGHIHCCTPESAELFACADTVGGGTDCHRDNETSFALGVARIYALTGDGTWLNTIKAGVRAALDYEIGSVSGYMNPTTKLVTTHDATLSDAFFTGDYWEKVNGTRDGYASLIAYDALRAWAKLEANVLGDATRAATYNSVADTLKANFNLDRSSGGFWSPATHTFYYGDGNQDVAWLGVNAPVLQSDIASLDRRREIAAAVEKQAMDHNANLHFLNYGDLFTAGVDAPPCAAPGENGAWYGQVEGEYYAAYPLLDDRTAAPAYTALFNDRWYANWNRFDEAIERTSDGTVGGDCGQQEWWPMDAHAIYGLWHFIYGLQPQYDRLVLAPYLSPTMAGTSISYAWRGRTVGLTYNSPTKFTINTSVALTTPVEVRFAGQAPSGVFHVSVDGGAATAATASADGDVVVARSAATTGSHTYECTDCVTTGEQQKGAGTSLATAVHTGTVHTDATTQVGCKVTVGSSPITVTQLGRYFLSGNSRIHALKLLDAGRRRIAQVAVDMSAGTADGLGFKYAALQSPVQLAAGGVYYLYSQERAGGDGWYDQDAGVATGSAATVNLASANDAATYGGAAGSCFGPLNLKYLTSPGGTSMVTSFSDGGHAPRNDTTVDVGASITVGASNVSVTHIGRYFLTGNRRTHLLRIVDASTNATVAGSATSINMAQGVKDANGFKYVRLPSPVTLTAGHTYYVLSSELDGGDQFYDQNTTQTLDHHIIRNGGVANTAPNGTSFTFFGGTMYGPVNILY